MLKERPDYLDKGKRDFEDLKEIVAALRSEDGCPWDRKQTHGSMRICVLEEAAETVDAIGLLEREQNPDGLREELGDLLLQVMLQSRLAEEEGYFTVEDVVEDISRKMIRRHPHVFGETVDRIGRTAFEGVGADQGMGKTTDDVSGGSAPQKTEEKTGADT